MKIYIAGKITNDKNYKEKFARAEKILQYFKKFFEKSIKSFDKNLKRIII